MNLPEIATTVIGSYPVPEWLRALPSEPALRDALLAVMKTQELAGIDVISDGEISRFDVNRPKTNGMIETFVRPLGGVRVDFTMEELESFRSRPGVRFRAAPAALVVGPLDAGLLNLPEAWRRVKELSSTPIKFTLTSPYMLARTVADVYYKDIRALASAFAEVLRAQVEGVDAPVIQIDEAGLTGNPKDASWAAEPINHVLDGVKGERALHLCFGNYGGQTIHGGDWKSLTTFFNSLHVDHLLLEFARRGYEELPLFRDLRDDITLGIGVVDVKDTAIEPAETVARRIEHAVELLGPARVKWVHPDCGLFFLQRSVADGKMASLVAGRDLVLGRR